MTSAAIALTKTEWDKLIDAKSADEWAVACDAIKAARNGEYPHDWHEKVLLSGLLTDMQDVWTKPATPKLTITLVLNENLSTELSFESSDKTKFSRKEALLLLSVAADRLLEREPSKNQEVPT